MKFEAGERFWAEGDELRQVLFPLNGLISVRVCVGPRKEVETALVGREGFVEVRTLLGATRACTAVVALTDGEALGMTTEAFHTFLSHRPFRAAAEAYSRVSLVMLERISACNRVHGIDNLVAGRLLHMQDRTGRQSFDITQDAFARQLGVRRASVSRAATQIQKHAAIQYDRRGRLTIVSRERLETLACSCYQVMKAEFDVFVDSRGGALGVYPNESQKYRRYEHYPKEDGFFPRDISIHPLIPPYVRRVTFLMHATNIKNIIESREHTPIWFAALVANECTATDRAEGRTINWRCSSGRALYTNSAREAEDIQPFGVSLRRGETLAVWWQPGETAYTLEVINEVNGLAA